MSIRKYEFKKTLDTGTFSKVKLAKDTITDELVAIKIIKKITCKVESIKKEVDILRSCNHSRIVQFYDLIQDERNYYIIMEHIDGNNLFDLVSEGCALSENICKKYFVQMISAIRYCHSQFISHRDLKLENIMIDSDDNVKIIDFGLSTRMKLNGEMNNTWCGSINYIPPEICKHNQYVLPPVDIWCLGIILFTMLTQKMPFGGNTVNEVISNVIKCNLRIPSIINSDAADLIRKMLQKNPRKRLPLAQVSSHPWLEDAPNVPLEIPDRNRPMGEQPIINLLIIDKMEKMGFDGDEAMKFIRRGDLNEYTSIYFELRDSIYFAYKSEFHSVSNHLNILSMIGSSSDSDDSSDVESEITRVEIHMRGQSEPSLKSSNDDIISPSLSRKAKLRRNHFGQKFLEKLFS